MTAQIPDTLLLPGQELFIVGVNGNGLFEPLAYGMQPFPRITSCWRGYVCAYKILYSKLLLNDLRVNLNREGPSVNNLRPVFSGEETFDNIYHQLHLHIDFSGGILAAGGFIQQLYVHMGFHPAWKYRNVFELILSHGRVIETRDVSEQMEQIRSEMVKAPLEPGAHATKQQIEEWVASTFKLDYNL